MVSLPPPLRYLRAFYAALRVLRFIYHPLFGRIDEVFIRLSYSVGSLLEKGLMCLLGKTFGKLVLITLLSEIKPFKDDSWSMEFKRTALTACDLIICQGETAATNLEKLAGVKRDKIVIIPNWIDPQPFQNRQRRPNTSGVIAFLFVGRMESGKGIRELLKASYQLRQEGASFRIVYCGSGSQFEPIQERCRQLNLEGVVDFAEWVTGDALIDRFMSADVFVLPTYREGLLPNALMQPLTAGLGVITTPVGSIPEVIAHGENRWLVQSRNVEQLISAMRQFIEHPEQALLMGAKNTRLIAHKYDIRQVWKLVADALDVYVPQVNS